MDAAEKIQPRLESAIGQRYEVIGPIGRGGMASVYLARHRVHGGFCAVKVLADHLAKQPPLVKSFLTEARASASLDEHPNIVNIVDIDEHAGLYFMIMKYVEGEDLSAYLKRKKQLPWRQAAYIAAEVAEALAYSHERGVIHRDLKPSNIRINRRGGITVMDFGIAKVGQTPSSFTEMGTRAGTPHYMAPEQITGAKVDHRSDLYGLGVILYQMTTGSRPFDGANAATVWQAHLSDEPAQPQEVEASIPDPLSHIMLTLLAKEADKRYDSAERLVRHLRTLGLDGVAATLEPVDQLDLDELRARTLSGHTAAEAFSPTPTITETGQTAAPPEVESEAEATPVAEATPTALPTPTPTPPPAEPADATAVEPPAAPTLPPPAPRPPPPVTDTFSTPSAPTRSPVALVVGAAVVAVAAIGGYFLLNSGGNEPTAPEPVVEIAEPAQEETVEEAPPAEAAPEEVEAPPSAPAPVAKAKAKPAPPRTGAVYFRTEPPGARIQVDNRPDWTCESPCWLESLRAGPHTVTARLAGFRVAIEKFEVEAGAREPLQLELEPDLISAMIASEPPGAEIYIDGEKRPEKTNARIPLAAGTYQVRVVLPGVAQGEQVLVVSENQMPFTNFVLEAK